MKKSFLFLLFTLFQLTVVAQVFDTTIVIQTKSSTIRIDFSGRKVGTTYFSNSISTNVSIQFGSEVIDEAMNRGISKDHLEAQLIYDSSCLLNDFVITSPPQLESLAKAFLRYKDEFKEAYEANHLRNFYKLSEEDELCGLERLKILYQMR